MTRIETSHPALGFDRAAAVAWLLGLRYDGQSEEEGVRVALYSRARGVSQRENFQVTESGRIFSGYKHLLPGERLALDIYRKFWDTLEAIVAADHEHDREADI